LRLLSRSPPSLSSLPTLLPTPLPPLLTDPRSGILLSSLPPNGQNDAELDAQKNFSGVPPLVCRTGRPKNNPTPPRTYWASRKRSLVLVSALNDQNDAELDARKLFGRPPVGRPKTFWVFGRPPVGRPKTNNLAFFRTPKKKTVPRQKVFGRPENIILYCFADVFALLFF
jgi:hypothetical protein